MFISLFLISVEVFETKLVITNIILNISFKICVEKQNVKI